MRVGVLLLKEVSIATEATFSPVICASHLSPRQKKLITRYIGIRLDLKRNCQAEQEIIEELKVLWERLLISPSLQALWVHLWVASFPPQRIFHYLTECPHPPNSLSPAQGFPTQPPQHKVKFQNKTSPIRSLSRKTTTLSYC